MLATNLCQHANFCFCKVYHYRSTLFDLTLYRNLSLLLQAWPGGCARWRDLHSSAGWKVSKQLQNYACREGSTCVHWCHLRSGDNIQGQCTALLVIFRARMSDLCMLILHHINSLIATIDNYIYTQLPHNHVTLPHMAFVIVLSAALQMVALWIDVAIVESSWWLICLRAQMRVTLGSWPFGVDRFEYTFHPSRLIMTFYLWVMSSVQLLVGMFSHGLISHTV